MATASDVRHAVMHILANGPPAVFAAATATDWQKEIDRRVGACPPIPAPGDRPAWANLFKVTLGDLVAESKYAALAYANAEEVLEREAVAHEAKCVMWGPYGSMLLAAARIARGTWLITTPWLVAKLAGITGQVPVGVSFIGGICAFAALGHFRGARRVANQWKGHGRAWSSKPPHLACVSMLPYVIGPAPCACWQVCTRR